MQNSVEVINCNGLPNGLKAYGGQAGQKKPVIYQGSLWLLKYPQNTKSSDTIMVSYTTSPLSEYIGSHIYNILGYDTHLTKLGVEGNKCVVLCKDFRPNNEEYYDFSQILSVSLGIEADEKMIEEAGNTTGPDGKGVNLKRILYTLDHNTFLPPESKDRFWDMFIVDGFISNSDRHNGNWGFLGDLAHLKLSPVFDNGNSFLAKTPDDKIEKILHDDNAFNNLIYAGNSPFFVRNKSVDLISAVRKLNFPYNDVDTKPLMKAIEKNVPLIQDKFPEIVSMIDDIPEYAMSNGQKVTIMTEARKQVYKKLLSSRLNLVLNKALNKVRQENSKRPGIHRKPNGVDYQI